MAPKAAPYMRMMLSSKGGPGGSPIIMRDQFTVDQSPMTSGPATPKGTRTVSGTGLAITNGRMSGGASAGTVSYTGIDRVGGRTFCVVMYPEDASNEITIALSETEGAVDGYVLRATGKTYEVELPDGTTVTVTKPEGISYHAVRQMLGITIRQTSGAVFWVSELGPIPGIGGEWPMYGEGVARTLFVTTQGTFSTAYPTITTTSAFSGLSYFEDARVVDVPEWSGSADIALFADRFELADQDQLGPWWTLDSGLFGILSQQAIPRPSVLFKQAWHDVDQKNVILVTEWIIDSLVAELVEIHARRSDAAADTNVIFYQAGANLYLESQVAGGFTVLESTGALPQVAGQTYQINFGLLEASYRAWVINAAGSQVSFGPVTDGGAAQNGTKHGLAHYQTPNATPANRSKWNQFHVYPIAWSLPSLILSGTTPTQPTVGSTISTDNFTAADGTNIMTYNAAWLSSSGTWTIITNRARNNQTSATNYFTRRNSGIVDHEVTTLITTGATLSRLRSGVIVRHNGVQYIFVRLFVDPAQPTSHEVEVWPSSGGILKKQDLGVYFAAATTYTLKVQCIGDLLHVYINDMPVLSIVLTDPNHLNGTWVGLYRRGFDGGSVDVTFWDDFVVKSLS